MKISIIVPNRNYAKYLPDCLDSIAMQTYKNIEVLLADGNSDDNSIEILESYSAKYGWKIYSREDQGQIDAISRGLELATGDIQCWLNSDDFFLSNKALEIIVQKFLAYPEMDIISLGGYYTNAEKKWLRPTKLLTHPLLRQSELPRRGGGLIQPSTFWKSKVFREIEIPMDFPYSFDTYFFLQANIRFNLLIEQSIYITGYRIHGSNLSTEINSKRIYELARLNSKFFGYKFRFVYLSILSAVVFLVDKLPFFSEKLKKIIYLSNNTLSYLLLYYLPSI